MKDKNLFYINLALAAVVAIVLFIFVRPYFIPKNVEVKKVSAKIVDTSAGNNRPVYDINKIKKPERIVAGETRSLEDVYKKFPESDTGDNMVKAWEGTSQEDKAKFLTGLDKQIETSREMLKSNPDNKKARSLLLVSEALKKMTENNFNYKRMDKPGALDSGIEGR